MGLETGTYISDLVSTNPTSGDPKSQGDDHIRLVKATLLATFPNVNGAVNPTDEQLNLLQYATESTFTPAITFGGASPGSYTSRSGTYIRVGTRVYFQIRIEMATKSGNTGDVVITGLPSTSTAVAQGVTILLRSGFTGLTGVGAGVVNASSTSILLYQTNATGSTPLTHAAFTTSSLLYASGFYEVL